MDVDVDVIAEVNYHMCGIKILRKFRFITFKGKAQSDTSSSTSIAEQKMFHERNRKPIIKDD